MFDGKKHYEREGLGWSTSEDPASLKASLAGVICVLTLARVPEGLLCAARVLAQAYKAVPMK